MALVPGLSYPNNFLFHHTGDKGHDFVLHQASVLAVTLLALTAALLATLYWLQHTNTQEDVQEESTTRPLASFALVSFALVALLIAFLLEPLSAPVWKHLPELAFLQFPWRFLSVLGVVLALTLGFLANRLRVSNGGIVVAMLAIVAGTSFGVSQGYLYKCDAEETPAEVAQLFRTGHGVSATDEYTPNNDILRSNDPAYWLAENAAAFAPGTTPNPNANAPDVDFGEPAPELTLSGQPPHHFTITLATPQTLILNLRDYPNWRVTARSGKTAPFEPVHRKRDDGLIAIALPAGSSEIDITWVRGWDRAIGLGISACALAVFLLALRRSRRIGC
jgi:hypothetical protein